MVKKDYLLKSIIAFSFLFSPLLQAKDVWILIHGTFANESAKVIPRMGWWKENQSFYQELNASSGKNATLHAFTWCGSNSHDRRVHAGKRLIDFIPTVATLKDNIHIVGHSHGANVALLGINELAKNKSRFKITTLYTLAVPVSSNYNPSMSHLKKLYNLFSFADFVQPVLSLFGRVFDEHQDIYNIQVKIDGVSPSHYNIHHPIIGYHLPNIGSLLPNNKPYCISFFSDKPPVATLDANREQDLEIDKSFTTQLITCFAESKKRGDQTLTQISQDTKARLLRLWRRGSLNPQSMSQSQS